MPGMTPAPAPTMQRRHSSASSDGMGSDQGLSGSSRHTSQENIALIPTRTSKISTTKPAANPLQFVKVGPCDLSRYAQEQVKKAEEVKKVKPERRDEAEDWQSNLDNWKCSRRKRQEHIIERVVEVKKLELEEHDRNRRRSKTFSEMMEERNMKGRKTSLPIYQDDNNDLSELGLSIPKTSEEDNVFHDAKDSFSSSDDLSRTSCEINGETSDSGKPRREKGETSSEPEEITYEQAIQNYVNFTESRVRGTSLTPLDSDHSNLTNGVCKKPSPTVPMKPRRGSCKIEEKLSELELMKKRSMSTNDLTDKRPLSVPKVDILKRKEMFEKPQEEDISFVKNRLSGDFGSSKSISDRLSTFGKSSESTTASKKTNRIASEISVKERLCNIEKQKSLDNTSPKSNTLPTQNPAITGPVKQKITPAKKVSSLEKTLQKPQIKIPVENIGTKSKQSTTATRGSSTKADIIKIEFPSSNKKNNEELHGTSQATTNELANGSVNGEKTDIDKPTNTYELTDPSLDRPVEEKYETKRQQHFRHRSLDSLDVDSNDNVGNESFERVQSLEDLDYCGNYPASSVSGDTDREDSGIHTADVSSSVSQADDCDLHLEGEFHQQPTTLEDIKNNRDHTLIPKTVNQISVSDHEIKKSDEVVPLLEMVETSSGFLKLPLKLDCDPLPVILESPSEPIPPITITDCFSIDTPTSSVTPNMSSHDIVPSQSNFTSNIENKYPNCTKIENVNIDFSSETQLCSLTLADGGGNNSVVNSVPVNTSLHSLSTLPVEAYSTEVLHDNSAASLEIIQKLDLNQLPSLLSSNPEDVFVEADCKFEKEEKGERALVGLNAVNVDLVSKPDSVSSILFLDTTTSLPITADNTQLMEAVFPLSPSILEPPKEKPPPPPTDVSDDEDALRANTKSVSLRRLDSTKRIKKEIRQKRSSFLGIDGPDDDNYLEPELELVRRPPDISSFLAEEKRLEQLLYRQSICSESESRDSGVELEKHHDDLAWGRHSRDNSEIYANASTTSEEEDIMKKEREIIELLEREEINRYTSNSQEKENIGERLAERLRELEAEKARLEWEREAEQVACAEQQTRIIARERELSKKEELLLVERERLEAEQASLMRLQQQYNRSLTDVRLVEAGYQRSLHTSESVQHCAAKPRPLDNRRSMQDLHTPEPLQHRPVEPLPFDNRRSMQDLRSSEPVQRRSVEPPPLDNRRSMQDLHTPEPIQHHPAEPPHLDNRRSMPDLTVQMRRPPPPIPPAKPLIIPRSPDKRLSSPQQMSRQTLQALSAAPKSRISDNWMQPRRKPNTNNNYQHWLVQEAEQRRITEHHERQAPPPRRPVPPPPPPQQSRACPRPSSGQYSNWQPGWGAVQPRSDKPLPDAIIQTLTQRVQSRLHSADPNNNRRRIESSPPQPMLTPDSSEKMLSVSGKKKCSHCGDELGRGAAMIIESLRLFYHIDCFKCCVCCVQLGDGLMGTDVRVRNNKLHCHNCYSSDDGVKFSCV